LLLKYMSSFFFSSRRRHTRFSRDWSSDVCSSDLVEVDNYFSVLAKGILPIQDNLSVYGLAGFSRVAVTSKWCDPLWGCVSGSGSESGLSLGAGAEFELTPQISLSAEYLMMVDDADAMSIRASYKF